jgi:hypothetical protein
LQLLHLRLQAAIVGMNSISFYLVFEIVVHRWLFDYSNTIVNGVVSQNGVI